jgi:hypothetical protein
MLSLDAPCFCTLAVPNEFRYVVWGQEPSSLTHSCHRLLTKKQIFSPAHYFTIGTSGNAVKFHILSAVLWLNYLQTSLFISMYQTQMKLEPPSGVYQQGISISV